MNRNTNVTVYKNTENVINIIKNHRDYLIQYFLSCRYSGKLPSCSDYMNFHKVDFGNLVFSRSEVTKFLVREFKGASNG